ncbi:hypothetical protein [Phreatobacter stygius]|uniref:Uncharacterized protein n=1 Tax=Phreatobacter stygius TaxID=1940610 RepID=A0A4D7BBV4_9HYPH|nr:hypothetical protein [Phreatobacter stygius]QCI68215.1 hypothetical protein E8M01_30715 [Phreatobacter stygius]
MRVVKVTLTGILTVVVATVALAAWIVAALAFVRAWIVANRSESFRALGFSRYVNWLGSLKHMPLEARAHLTLFFKAFAVFFAALAAALVVGVATARS